jgi:hypothetical protein
MVCETGTPLRVAAIALAIVATYFAFNAQGRRAGICAAIFSSAARHCPYSTDVRHALVTELSAISANEARIGMVRYFARWKKTSNDFCCAAWK